MENDSIVTEVSETIQDTSTLSQMTAGFKQLTSTPISEWLPDLVKTYVVPLGFKILAAIIVLIWVAGLSSWSRNGWLMVL